MIIKMKILGNSLGERCALLGSFHREERNKYMIYILFWYRLSSFSFFSLSRFFLSFSSTPSSFPLFLAVSFDDDLDQRAVLRARTCTVLKER